MTTSFQQIVPIIRQGDELSKALVGARRTLAINESIPVLPRTPEELWLRPLPFLSLPLLWQRAGGGKSRLRQMCVSPGDESLGQTTIPSSKLTVPETTSEHVMLCPVPCLLL